MTDSPLLCRVAYMSERIPLAPFTVGTPEDLTMEMEATIPFIPHKHATEPTV